MKKIIFFLFIACFSLNSYSQIENDSLARRIADLEQQLNYYKAINSYAFAKQSKELTTAGILMITGAVVGVAGLCLAGVSLTSKSSVENLYIPAAGCILASIIFNVIAGSNIYTAGKISKRLSFEYGKMVIEIE